MSDDTSIIDCVERVSKDANLGNDNLLLEKLPVVEGCGSFELNKEVSQLFALYETLFHKSMN